MPPAVTFEAALIPLFLTLIPPCTHIHAVTHTRVVLIFIYTHTPHRVCVCPAHGQMLNRYPSDWVHSGSRAPGLYGNCSSGLHTLLYTYSSNQTPYDVFSEALPPGSYGSQYDFFFPLPFTSLFPSSCSGPLFHPPFTFLLTSSLHFPSFFFFTRTHCYLVRHALQAALEGTGF